MFVMYARCVLVVRMRVRGWWTHPVAPVTQNDPELGPRSSITMIADLPPASPFTEADARAAHAPRARCDAGGAESASRPAGACPA